MLIDEFGKGTASIDGISLLAASISELLRMKCRTVITTHFLEIFTHSLVPSVVGRELAFRMDIHVPDEEGSIASATGNDPIAVETVCRGTSKSHQYMTRVQQRSRTTSPSSYHSSNWSGACRRHLLASRARVWPGSRSLSCSGPVRCHIM